MGAALERGVRHDNDAAHALAHAASGMGRGEEREGECRKQQLHRQLQQHEQHEQHEQQQQERTLVTHSQKPSI